MENALTQLPTENEWDRLKEIAEMAVRSKLIPVSIDTPEKAIIIALKGRELGLPPMVAFSHINVIQGKPCCSSELMLAHIHKEFPNAEIVFETTTGSECVIKARRKPESDFTEFKMTFEEAHTAGFAKAWDRDNRTWVIKDNWKKQPKTMLRWRMISEMKRFLFPEVLMGLDYTPDEIDELEVRNVTPNFDTAPVELPMKTIKSEAIVVEAIAEPEKPTPATEKVPGAPFVRSAKDPKPEEPAAPAAAKKKEPSPAKLERDKLVQELLAVQAKLNISRKDFFDEIALMTQKGPGELNSKELGELIVVYQQRLVQTQETKNV